MGTFKRNVHNLILLFFFVVVACLFAVNLWVAKEIDKASEFGQYNLKNNNSVQLANQMDKSRTYRAHRYKTLNEEGLEEKSYNNQAPQREMVDARKLEKQKIFYEIPLDEDVLLH